MSIGGMFSQTRQRMPRPRWIAASERKIDVLIIASEPPASGAVEPVDAVKPSILPAAIFIAVEILLAAETISVVLLRAIDPQNLGAAVIAILLSVALLANLGVVCSMAATVAANSVRQWKRERARSLSDWFAAADSNGEGIESAAADIADIDLSGSLVSGGRALAMPASG